MFWAYLDDAAERYLYSRRLRIENRDAGEFQNAPFHDWLDRLAVMGIIQEDDYHREGGKADGIPACCIKWFIFMSCEIKITDCWSVLDFIYGRSNTDTECGYVRCPKCRKGK